MLRRRDDAALEALARDIGVSFRRQGWNAIYLIHHGNAAPGESPSAHAENKRNVHVLELDGVEVDDLLRLRELLVEAGTEHVVVKRRNESGEGNTVVAGFTKNS